MDGNYSRSAIADRRLEGCGLEPERFIHLCENRNGSGNDDRVHRGDECESRKNYLVATADPESGQRSPQSGGPTRRRDRVLGAQRFPSRSLERRDLSEQIRAVVAK
jgi:hypothetical protein